MIDHPTSEVHEILTPSDKVNKLNLPFVILGFLPCFAYVYRYGSGAFNQGINDVMVLWFFPPVLLGGYVLHEFLHMLTFSAVGFKPITYIKMGIRPTHLLPFLYPVYPLKAWAMRLGMLVPWLVVGVLPMLMGLETKTPELFFPGVFFSCFSSGDLAWFYTTWKVPMNAWMEINPNGFGCIWYKNLPENKELEV